MTKGITCGGRGRPWNFSGQGIGGVEEGWAQEDSINHAGGLKSKMEEIKGKLRLYRHVVGRNMLRIPIKI